MTDRLEREFSTADLGDVRLTKRAGRIVRRWGAMPDVSFPSMAESEADLQGLYGFLENDAVDFEELMAAHGRETLGRIDAGGAGQVVLVVHDTTSFAFGGGSEREGLGWLGYDQQGFFAHVALAVSSDGSRQPLGVLGMSHRMRERPVRGAVKKKHDGKTSAADPNRESLRWGELVDETTERLRGHARAIHVMDREADAYGLLCGMVQKHQRFIVRAKHFKRPVTLPGDETRRRTRLHLVAEGAVPLVGREAHLARRPKSPLPAANKKHPPRVSRVAKLEFASETVTIPRAHQLDPTLPPSIDVQLVHVREIEPPAGVEPVEWLLLTSETVETAEDLLRVVDGYRARWLIEEFFKAIKTGCQYETRQLESAHALLIALALCIPVAWQMLALRHLSRQQPETAASSVFSLDRLQALRTIARKPLPPTPTARDVFLAIAALGGHIARNGPPGWQTLRLGLDKLLFAEHVLDAARRSKDPLADL